jgi:hypothetical protein
MHHPGFASVVHASAAYAAPIFFFQARRRLVSGLEMPSICLTPARVIRSMAPRVCMQTDADSVGEALCCEARALGAAALAVAPHHPARGGLQQARIPARRSAFGLLRLRRRRCLDDDAPPGRTMADRAHALRRGGLKKKKLLG